ncbi:hypothetical protein P43SY_011595 [Pythium insidiosum]|uniref:Uncharacterized protein n=1 Tax=Pythium insidiosum TaxID=114742 RepID=A0AAD5L9V0_PYTIN|nr:hypothetical protein P43SY_011595 [Pythium insidiosum]
MEITQTEDAIYIAQSKYAREILEKFGYSDAHKSGNPMETNVKYISATCDDAKDSTFDYRGAIGMLIYLATSTRPDLAYALGQLSRFVSCPTKVHVGAVKRVLRYLVGSVDQSIRFTRRMERPNEAVMLRGYCDSDWGGDPETRKCTGGFVFELAGGAVSWLSKRQPIIALSTAEAEYIAACEAAMEATTQYNILTEMFPTYQIKAAIGIDSQAIEHIIYPEAEHIINNFYERRNATMADMLLVILRGMPGSGKTRFARFMELYARSIGLSVRVCSANDFFEAPTAKRQAAESVAVSNAISSDDHVWLLHVLKIDEKRLESEREQIERLRLEEQRRSTESEALDRVNAG